MDLRRFDDLLRVWQDGEASPEEARELDQILRDHPELGRELVNSVMVEVNLYRRYAVQSAPKAAPRRRTWEVAAAILVLAVSAVLVGRVLVMDKRTPVAGPSVTPVRPAPAATPRRRTPLPTPSVAACVRMLDASSFSLIQALDRALEAGAGVPVGAEIEEEDGQIRLSVAFAAGTRVRELEYDAKTLTLIDDQVEDDDCSEIAGALKISMKAAMEKTLAVFPGRLLEAEAEMKNGRPLFEIKVLIENEIREVKIDAVSGEFLKR